VNILKNTEAFDIQNWPRPDEFAEGISRRLVDQIAAEISQNGGQISFAEFMKMALYQPGLGYYSAGARKFGEDGDFITAPEMSPLFSRCLARQCEEIISEFKATTILELGAGSGIMARDILDELQRRDSLPSAYLILEPSADLRERQRQLLQDTLPELAALVTWLDKLPDQPFKGIVLANEVLDAMPVHRVRNTNGTFHELQVSIKEEMFNWVTQPMESDLTEKVNNIVSTLPEDLPEDYVTEINMSLTAMMTSLSSVLDEGWIILIDYGYPRREYFHPQRMDGTLQCYYRHRVHADPFVFVGLQDITSSVDFTAIAEPATSIGLQLGGFTTQSNFLIGNGLHTIIEEYGNSDDKLHTQYSHQAMQLLLPGRMGELCKVMALSKNFEKPLSGFEFADHQYRL